MSPHRGKGTGTLKVLFAVSETVPWAKTGGLGDVAGALPEALLRRAMEINRRVFGPSISAAASGSSTSRQERRPSGPIVSAQCRRAWRSSGSGFTVGMRHPSWRARIY